MLADYVFNGRFSRFFSGPRCTSRMPSRTRAGLACRAMCLRRLPPFAQETLIDSSLDLCRDILARHTAAGVSLKTLNRSARLPWQPLYQFRAFESGWLHASPRC